MSSRTSTDGRRRRFANETSSSSRRLSAVVNPDVLNDVSCYVSDEFARRTPARRHSIASLRLSPFSPEPRSSPPVANRAVSERIQLSKTDQKILLKTENEIRKLDEVHEGEDEHEKESSTFMLVFGLFLAYILSNAGLQKLNDLRPGCGQLVTLLQYIATIVEQAPHAQVYLSKPVLPMYLHLSFVLLMFLSIKMGNASLGVGLPFGLFLVIKNTNLAWSLLLGLFGGRAFTASQIISIGVVTAGISICVLAQNQGEGDSKGEESENGLVFGAALCAASTFCMAALGSLQEVIFTRYKDGQVASESLFFTHLLGLPLFAVGGGMNQMQGDIHHLLETLGMSISMLAVNILFALVVKHCFVGLLEENESVTATLTLAVARMTGVIISEVMEGTGSLHFWLGALLVAMGSISYATGGKLSCRRT